MIVRHLYSGLDQCVCSSGSIVVVALHSITFSSRLLTEKSGHTHTLYINRIMIPLLFSSGGRLGVSGELKALIKSIFVSLLSFFATAAAAALLQ